MTIKRLVGEIIETIDVSDEQIRIKTQSGRVFMIEHDQDCCESVSLESVDGSVAFLIGKPVLDASEEFTRDIPPPDGQGSESYTWSLHKFVVDDATVVTRWFGESNGYYGETADIKEITYSNSELVPDTFDREYYWMRKDDWLSASDYWAVRGEVTKSRICRSIAEEMR